MKNQMFVPNSLQIKALEKEQAKHQKRLDQIQTEDRKAKNIEKDLTVSLKVSQTRQHNLKLAQKGKVTGLEQENELLLGKLVEISRKKSPNFTIRSESASGKSLHAPFKKREMLRISSENEAFAKRLISQQSTFNRKKLDTDFKKHKELVGNMKRVGSSPGKIVSSLGKKVLPSLKSELQSPKALNLKPSNLKSSAVKENKENKDTKEAKEIKEIKETQNQPQQESTVVASAGSNDNKIAVNPVNPENKPEVKPKPNETVEASTVKENTGNTVPVLENTQPKSQEVAEKPNQGNQSQRSESPQVVKGETGEKETK